MADASSKAEKWIKNKRDPRIAHWQAGLESILDLLMPNLEKGRIIPAARMNDQDLHLFKSTLKKVDICPSIYAAFLPQAIADIIVPPDSVEETWRIEKNRASCKIIILRPGEQNRIIAAEISEKAHKPGIDIFQSGALLGSFNYQDTEECLDGLNKAVKAHAWKKGAWQEEEVVDYTLNWFERVRYLNTDGVSVDKAYSFFHSPTLIRTNRIDALLKLFYIHLNQQYTDPGYLQSNPQLAEKIKQRDLDFCRTLAQTHILEMLNLVKELNIMDFSKFSESEEKKFQAEFVRTEEKLQDRLMHLEMDQ